MKRLKKGVNKEEKLFSFHVKLLTYVVLWFLCLTYFLYDLYDVFHKALQEGNLERLKEIVFHPNFLALSLQCCHTFCWALYCWLRPIPVGNS